MSRTFNPEIAELRDKVEGCIRELAELRGTVNQLNTTVHATMRQSIWQLIALIVSVCMTVGGGLAFQTHLFEKRFEQIDKRFEQVEKRIELSEKNISARFEQVEKRIELSEKNISARFEDLKQEVRAQRK